MMLSDKGLGFWGRGIFFFFWYFILMHALKLSSILQRKNWTKANLEVQTCKNFLTFVQSPMELENICITNKKLPNIYSE